MRKPAPALLQPPNWNYSHLGQLDAAGWYAELTRLCKLSVDNDLGLFQGDPNISLSCRLGKPGEVTQTEISHIGLPTVQFVGPREPGFWLPPYRLPALIVNVHAPDAVIRKELARTLKEVRKYFGPPVARRGQYVLNHFFDDDTFKKWRGDKIVELADLLAWNAARKSRGERLYPEHTLGSHIGRHSARQTSETKATLRKALTSLPALGAQIAQGIPKAGRAEELIAAQIARALEHQS